MEQQLTEMKTSTDERIAQGEQDYQTTQEAWQEAIARASEAERRAEEFEKALSHLREQQQVDEIHKQLWPAGQAAGNSSHDTSMEEPASNEGNGNKGSSDDDTEMDQVKSII
jgi:hypothetical protein